MHALQRSADTSAAIDQPPDAPLGPFVEATGPVVPPFQDDAASYVEAMRSSLVNETAPSFGDTYRRALVELYDTMGFTEQMLIEQLEDTEIVKALLADSPLPPDVQVILLANWQCRRDFVMDLKRLAVQRGKDVPIRWIEPLPSPRAEADLRQSQAPLDGQSGAAFATGIASAGSKSTSVSKNQQGDTRSMSTSPSAATPLGASQPSASPPVTELAAAVPSLLL